MHPPSAWTYGHSTELQQKLVLKRQNLMCIVYIAVPCARPCECKQHKACAFERRPTAILVQSGLCCSVLWTPGSCLDMLYIMDVQLQTLLGVAIRQVTLV